MTGARLAAMAALLIVSAQVSAAEPVGIRHAVYRAQAPAHLEIVFDSTFGTAEAVTAAQDPAHYTVIDLYSGEPGIFAPKALTIDRAVVPSTSLNPAERQAIVQLFIAGNLPGAQEDRYVLVVSGLTIGEVPAAVRTTPTPVTLKIATASATKPRWVKAADRDTADLFFQGAWSRSAGTDFHGSLDIKVQYPAIEKTIGGRLHSFTPTFDLATSADPDADPDALAIGAAWQFFPIDRSGGLVPLSRWENAIEHESSHDFDYRTVVWRSEWLFLPPAWHVGQSGRFWVNPVVGVAAGRILDAPGQAFDHGGLLRLLGGASATFDTSSFFGRTLTVEGEYQVRRQYQDEPVGEVTLGKGSHHWKRVAAEVAFNDFVSLGATYKSGEQPPTYQRVRDSLTIDLTFKAARRNKAR